MLGLRLIAQLIVGYAIAVKAPMILESLMRGIFSTLKNQSLILISLLLIFEIISVLWAYPEYHANQAEDLEGTKNRVETLQSRALTLGGLAFTGFSILISASININIGTISLRLLAFSIGLLFISYQLKELSTSREAWRIMQEKTLSYGFLTLFLATVVIYPIFAQSVSWIVSSAFILAAGLRFWTVKEQAEMYYNMRNKKIEESRPSWLRTVWRQYQED
jgi:hypothetical protein